METDSLFKKIIGQGKTLIITCHECGSQIEENDNTFVYCCLGNMLRKQDNLQQEYIRHHIEVKKCSKLILAGHYDCAVIQKIVEGTAENAPLILYNVDALIKGHSHKLISKNISHRLICELNVIKQIFLLLDFPFVKSKVEHGELEISGVILDDYCSTIREISRNGITYNDLIASN